MSDAWSAVWEAFDAKTCERLPQVLRHQGADNTLSTAQRGIEACMSALLREGFAVSGVTASELLLSEARWEDLREAEAAVRALQLPDGSGDRFLQGAVSAMDRTTRVGQGAVVGATIGSVVPGVGTAIGGAVGAWIGQSIESSSQEPVLQQFDETARQVRVACDGALATVWETVAVQNGLESWAWLLGAGQAFVDLETPSQADIQGNQKARRALQRWLKQWGPDADALNRMVRLCIPPAPRPALAAAAKAAALSCRLYPWRGESWEDAADVALARADAAAALEAARAGLKRIPGHSGLTFSRIEALALAGRHADSSALVRRQKGHAAWLFQARGYARAGDPPRAVSTLNSLAEEVQSRHGAAHLVRQWPELRRLRAFPDVPESFLARAKGIVHLRLQADGEKTFLGVPPGEQGRNMRRELQMPTPNEELLWFFDWSLWTNGNNGVAITDKRLLWKCAFTDPVDFEWGQINKGTVGYDDTSVFVNGLSVDVEDAGFAEAITSIAFELAAD